MCPDERFVHLSACIMNKAYMPGYSMMNLEKVNVIAADGSKAIAMFKLPGGAVVAQGSQQPDRKITGADLGRSSAKAEVSINSRKTPSVPDKGRRL